MKVHLMYCDSDFEKDLKITPHQLILIQDLELDRLFGAMAKDDKIILEVVRKAVLNSLEKKEEILYRQDILKDCIRNPAVIRKLYTIAATALERKKKTWWSVSSMYLSSILSGSVELLQIFAEMLREIRDIAGEQEGKFQSKGFTALFSMMKEELNDDYMSVMEKYLEELRFQEGILISARLGNYNQGVQYVLRSEKNTKHRWLKWSFAPSYTIAPRDDSASTDLSKRQDRAINLTTSALAQSADHVLSFFMMLQAELAFYVGCLNLYEQLSGKGEPVVFPVAYDCHDRRFSVKGLYDVSLSLALKERVVGNHIHGDGKGLVIITGANQGGKSTFLRSAGQAQLMMQCGMFVPAEDFGANICTGVFTHFKKEEDSGMKSGKLDEELARMNDIVNELRPNNFILFNESFASTNEKEGSEIGRQIVRALLEKQIKVFFVSHLYDFSHGFYEQRTDNILFLRAQRYSDGNRTFCLDEGEPLPTSYGEDIYNKIFDRANT